MASRKLLNGWKEIASYMGRGVRSVQRYEADLKLPIRRPEGSDRSSVFAFSDELDEWLQRSAVRSRPYVRPILIVVDPPDPYNISQRKLALELEKFNVLTAFSEDEALAAAQRIDAEGFIVNCAENGSGNEICEMLKQRYPTMKVFAVVAPEEPGPRSADYVIQGDDVRPLLDCVLKVFGKPSLQ